MPFFNKKDACKKHYKFGKTLGTGSFATVVLATHNKEKTQWAVKVIKKAQLTQEDKDGLEVEVQAMEMIKHDNIVEMREVFDTPTIFYMVMEVCYGGELFDRVVAKTQYSEGEAQCAVRQAASALWYCHQMKIVHRDLKPENLLYATKKDDSLLKVADFGLAKVLSQDQMMKTACGTPGYVAPEILSGNSYGESVDVWSLGVITYILLCGFPPFHAENNYDLFKSIKAGSYSFPSPYWDKVSTESKHFIERMLCVDVEKRIKMEEVCSHPWVTGVAENVAVNNISTMLPELKKYTLKRKFKAGLQAAAAVQRFRVAKTLQPPSEGLKAAVAKQKAAQLPTIATAQTAKDGAAPSATLSS